MLRQSECHLANTLSDSLTAGLRCLLVNLHLFERMNGCFVATLFGSVAPYRFDLQLALDDVIEAIPSNFMARAIELRRSGTGGMEVDRVPLARPVWSKGNRSRPEIEK